MSWTTSAGATIHGWWKWWKSPTGRMLALLGPFQIIAGGTSLFALGVMGQAVFADTGWPRSLVFSGLTVGLLASALVSAWIGRQIDRLGGKPVMVAGIVLNGACCAAMAMVTSVHGYLAVWALVGVAMRMTLYDATFALIVQRVPGDQNRVAISTLTVIGGLAATTFWPLGHALNVAYGWRTTYLIFAALNLCVALPMLLAALRRREFQMSAATDASHGQPKRTTPDAKPLAGRARQLAMVLFSVVMSANAFIFGALTVHMVGIIETTGLAAGVAVALASLKGAAQALGRLWELLFARNLSPMTIARISVLLGPTAFIILVLSGASVTAALVFTLVIGASHGLVTIVRGTLPLILFGRDGYGAILGILATPYLLLNALAPMLLAFVIDLWGYRPAVLILLAVATAATVAMEIMAFWYKRQQSSANRSGRADW
jgi:MFS family permease